jgi:DNA-directed RNA polymerase specialized sigma24 family protein
MEEPMNQSEVVALREFLSGLVGDCRPSAIPAVLHRLARRALGQHQHQEVDDCVAELVAKVWQATQRQSPGGARELLALDDRRLLAVLRHRLRQVACAGYEAWPQMKSLRSHVKAVLGGSLPDVDGMPLTLMHNDRLWRPLVAEAVSAVLAGAHPPSRSVAVIADALFGLYFGGDVGEVAPEMHPTPEEVVALCRDAPVEARRLEHVLGTDAAVLVAQRSAGASLSTLAAARGVATSTAHAWVQQAQARLRRGPSFETRAAALQLLAAGSKRQSA